MKIACNICVVNRSLPNLAHLKKKHVKSTLALCRHPKNKEYCLMLFSGHNKNGTKYPVNQNIKHVLTKFIHEGKCTIQIKNPEHDLYIQGDAIQIKGFLHLFKRALEGKISDKELTCSSMAVTPIKAKDIAQTKLIISRRSEYPIKGFPRTLEVLYVNNIDRCALDKGILQLFKLRVLNLSGNLIEYLPNEINKLACLKELNVSRNCLGKASLSRWSWIGGELCKSLVLLDLSRNELGFVPDQIAKLHSLTTLHLNDNHLTTLPTSIGSLRHLKVFSAAYNRLTILPGSVKMLRLQSIDLSNNRFEQNVPNGAGIFPRPLPACSLKEYAGKKVLWARIPFPPGSIPTTLIDFLDHAKYCVCGKACFGVFVRHSHNLLLSTISEMFRLPQEESIPDRQVGRV
ncbi:leucine-rich repeat protein 1 isoform X2 [Cylas formicarius]|uniref:leucine-rich repeat protein 1 isoform X2 n=1 Tax=Cylas formicarius TaxID=197179 RepID=UPI0029584C96|nr:leucine-rich repeat protein 1 isoform X2 [Cylas formicarius]